MIHLQCDACSREYKIREYSAGRNFQCRGCGRILEIPATTGPPSVEDSASASPPGLPPELPESTSPDRFSIPPAAPADAPRVLPPPLPPQEAPDLPGRGEADFPREPWSSEGDSLEAYGPEPPPRVRERLKPNLLISWLAVSCLATIVSRLLVGLMQEGLHRYWLDRDLDFTGEFPIFLLITQAAVFSFVDGLLVGGAQSLLLARMERRLFWWLPVTLSVRLVLSPLLILLEYCFPEGAFLRHLGGLLEMLFWGGVVGVAQFLLLRTVWRRAWIWIPATVIAYSIASALTLYLMRSSPGVLQEPADLGWIVTPLRWAVWGTIFTLLFESLRGWTFLLFRRRATERWRGEYPEDREDLA